MEAKVARLYEQQGADFVRIEVYLCHWLRWVRSGLGEVVGRLGLPVVSLVVGRGGLEAVRRVTPYAR